MAQVKDVSFYLKISGLKVCAIPVRGKASPVEVLTFSGVAWGMGREGFPSTSITALKGNVSGQVGVKEYYKITPSNKHHIRDLLRGKNPVGWLPLFE